MLKLDYFLKQIEEFGKVLGTILGLKLNRKLAEMENLIKESTLKYTSTEIEHTESIPDEILLSSLVEQHKLNDEQLKILADLLFEHNSESIETFAREKYLMKKDNEDVFVIVQK